jgi:MFS family permease
MTSPFRQPRAVWAVAFACVISFMGIGLVDPILPALSTQLHATPSQVTLLFTSYLVVTAVAMLVTGWVSSRIGAKNTLIAGLVLIVVFAGLAGSTDTIGGIVGFRAGWGLGNALFIATSLAVIVGSATGRVRGRDRPLRDGAGHRHRLRPAAGRRARQHQLARARSSASRCSWRSRWSPPCSSCPALPAPPRPAPLSAPLKALRHRGCSRWASRPCSTTGASSPCSATCRSRCTCRSTGSGAVFFGWGLLVAVFSVFVAPRLQGRFGTAPTLYVNLALFALVLAVIAAFTDHPVVLIVCVVVAGAMIGVNNTLTTQAVMLVAPVERPVASAAYGFIRFIGGGLAPFAAGLMAERFDVHVPFWIGAGAVVAAIAVLATGHRLLAAADVELAAGEAAHAGEPDLDAAELEEIARTAPASPVCASAPRPGPRLRDPRRPDRLVGGEAHPARRGPPVEHRDLGEARRRPGAQRVGRRQRAARVPAEGGVPHHAAAGPLPRRGRRRDRRAATTGTPRDRSCAPGSATAARVRAPVAGRWTTTVGTAENAATSTASRCHACTSGR